MNEKVNDELLVSDKESEGIALRQPRPIYLEFLLHFFSLGFYTPFWLVGRVRELNLLGANFTPWLWFFVPIISIAQPFSLPKLKEELIGQREKYSLPAQLRWGGFWVLAVFVVSFSINLIDKLGVYGWLMFPLLFLWAGLFCISQLWINEIKLAIPNAKFQGPKNNFKIWEWLVLLILGSLWVFIFYDLVVQPLTNKNIASYEVGTSYSDEKYGITLRFETEGWRQVEVGTISDGSAYAEFLGPADDMYIAIFEHGFESRLDDVQNYRRDDFYESVGMSRPKCEESRELVPHTSRKISLLRCEGDELGLEVLQLNKLFLVSGRPIEIYGYFSSPSTGYRMLRHHIEKAMQGAEI